MTQIEDGQISTREDEESETLREILRTVQQIQESLTLPDKERKEAQDILSARLERLRKRLKTFQEDPS